MSLNTIVTTSVTQPYAMFISTVPSTITGWRLNHENKRVEFILEGVRPDAPFDHDQHVLEIYTEQELTYVRRFNRYLFDNGLLIPYTGEPPKSTDANVKTDADIDVILATAKNKNAIQKAIEDITSPVTLSRIFAAAKERGTPKTVLEVIEARYNMYK